MENELQANHAPDYLSHNSCISFAKRTLNSEDSFTAKSPIFNPFSKIGFFAGHKFCSPFNDVDFNNLNTGQEGGIINFSGLEWVCDRTAHEAWQHVNS
jgi:hypothetical protein